MTDKSNDIRGELLFNSFDSFRCYYVLKSVSTVCLLLVCDHSSQFQNEIAKDDNARYHPDYFRSNRRREVFLSARISARSLHIRSR